MGRDGGIRLIKYIWHSIVRGFFAYTLCVLCRVQTIGRKNVPRKGAALILCNHQCYLDPFFSQSWFFRHFFFVARASLYGGKILGPLLRSFYIIPIKQGEGDISAMRAIISELKRGSAVCLYPEGARCWDGKIAEVKPGFALLSRRGNAPVIPTVIEGAFEVWPRNGRGFRIRKVMVHYGEPISVDRVKELGDREFARFLTRKLQQMHNELRVKMGRQPFDYENMQDEVCEGGERSAI